MAARWDSITIDFDLLGDLKPPIEAVLKVLQAIEAILESLLDLLKIFALDLLNPLRAIMALLLAAIRAIINQLRATGFSFLLVHPDFNQTELDGILNSVSGAYPAFESKVIGKFFDTGDLFRPTYPPGSSAAMIVFYIGADSPGDLLSVIRALLRLFSSPVPISMPPAPVGLKIGPITKGGNSIAQFRRLFDSDLDKALSIEWKLPVPKAGGGAAGVINQFSSFIQSFAVPNFIIERSTTPGGKTIIKNIDTMTQGVALKPRLTSLTGLTVNNKVSVREKIPGAKPGSGPVYKHFEKRIDVPSEDLVRGALTGTYKYIDNDDDLISGATWYYRIRAYFGDATAYLSDFVTDFASNGTNNIIKQNSDFYEITFGDIDISPPSAVVQAVVPDVSAAMSWFNAYEDVYDAVKAAILLNFEMPQPTRTSPDYARQPNGRETYTRYDQRSGWGTLAAIGGQVGALKAAYSKASQLRRNIIFKQIARRITNMALVDIYSKPQIRNLLAEKWNGPIAGEVEEFSAEKLNSQPDSVYSIVHKVLSTSIDWTFIGIVGGSITEEVEEQIDEYLSREDSYNTIKGKSKAGPLDTSVGPSADPNDQIKLAQSDVDAETPAEVQTLETGSDPTPKSKYSGPLPLDEITIEERLALAEFLRIALIPLNGTSGYLAWYGVTLGDIFPNLMPFLFDFEQFIKSLLRALESAIKELQAIIEAILQKIRMLEQILRSLLQLIDILSISVRVSVLTFSDTNSSATDLANQILTSADKPSNSPFGLHSGLVLTAGGPGKGFIKALEAIKFVLSLPVQGADSTSEELESALST